jgi:sulfur-oxidizing protein SoxB
MTDNRRTFIKKLGIVGAATGVAAFSPHIQESEPSEVNNNLPYEEGKEYTLHILQTTDVHCQVHPHDELFWENDRAVFRKTGGYAQMASFFKKARKSNPDTFIIDTGDMFQGSELSVKTTGKALVPVLNQLGYDLYLPGNWEVIYGKRNMQTLLGALDAPKICANMYHDLGEGKRGELIFLPYYVWNIRGVKIGFLGYTDPMVPLRQSPNYSKGILYTPPEENIAHYVSVLKDDERCDYVIVIAHLGLSQQIYLANLPQSKGIDYILGGDTHERVRIPIQCTYAKVVEPGAFGSFAGSLRLTAKDGKIIREKYELIELNADTLKEDKDMAALIETSQLPYDADINKVVGHSTLPLYRYFVVENTIDTLILNALAWQLKDVDIVLSNGFRFCPPRSTPDHTGNIPITEGFIFDMLPVDSYIRRGKITGVQIMEWLEKELNNVFAKNAAERFGGWMVKFKGMEITFKAFGEKGNRVQTIVIGGQPLEPEKTYEVCACERDGDPADMICRIRGVKDPVNTNITLHTVMKNYLQANSPVTPTPPLAAKILDGPQTLLTQVTGVDYKFR